MNKGLFEIPPLVFTSFTQELEIDDCHDILKGKAEELIISTDLRSVVPQDTRSDVI